MTKLFLATTVIAIASVASIASADRGRSSRGGDYHRGSDSRGSRDYGRDSGHRDSGHRDSGRHYDRSRSGFSFSFGASSGGYGNSSFFGLGYSRGSSRGYGHGGYVSPRYYRSNYYYAPAPVIIASPPVVYERYYAPTYYAPTYSRYDAGGYYCR